MRVLSAIFCMFLFSSPTIHAQGLPAVHVSSASDDTSDEKECQIRNASVVSAVESELRHNRITLASREQYISSRAIAAETQITTLKTPDGLCVVSYSLQVLNYQRVKVDVTQQERWANIVLCYEGGVMTGGSANLQGRLNTQFRDLTSMCVSKYLKN